MENNPLMPSCVLVACDATKDRGEQEFRHMVNGIRLRGDILHRGDTLMVIGVLHKVLHPFGYQLQACPDSFPVRALEEQVSKKLDTYVRMLVQSAEECEDEAVDIEVKITAGSPLRRVVLQEITTCNAAWVVLDRHLRRDLRSYLKHIPCKVAVVLDNLSVEVLRPYAVADTDNIEHQLVFSLSKPVPLKLAPDNENTDQSVMTCDSYPLSSFSSMGIFDTPHTNVGSSFTYKSRDLSSSSEDFGSFKQDKSGGRYVEGEKRYSTYSPVIHKQRRNSSRQRSSTGPILCTYCATKTELYVKDSMRFSFSEIQLATNDFSKEKLLGEGGYGFVYKGELKDGQLIAAKVRKEESAQGFSEFQSEVYVLSFARHKNIVMLLGYCCKEKINILVYEYICNMSLEWHLFDEKANVLEWHRRFTIAVGTAKGLRFLHEECRGSPIIHRDMRPSNILLTHDYVPMLGDFGLAKWKTNDENVQTRILGTFGYLAPEYVENGTVSVRTDVYSFGMVLIQLISRRKVVDSNREDHHKSLRLWAVPLIERLALHELIDPRIEDSYDTYELYHMARTAYLCVQTDPELRPSMGEVVRLLEGESDHLHHLTEKFMPHFGK